MSVQLSTVLCEELEKIVENPVLRIQSVSGGDINDAYRIETKDQSYFLKVNQYPNGVQMLDCEADGLRALSKRAPLRVPRVLGRGTTTGQHWLLLEYFAPGGVDNSFWERFGQQLAQLHRQSSPMFGWDGDNYIGSLPQSNVRRATWAEFYAQERLEPQLRRALNSGRLQATDLQNAYRLYKKLTAICPEEPPALTHGDLWSGNFLVAADGSPVLIDPSVSYAHREMDLALSQLFGGFAPLFYRAYQDQYPVAPNFAERITVYQLYYILVHVNLFGGSYVQQARRILAHFGG